MTRFHLTHEMTTSERLVIRVATADDAPGKGYVHYRSWIETYTGIFDSKVMDHLSLERSVAIARDHPENTYVALYDGVIVGFSCYLEARDDDLHDAGEVMALYVLKSQQGLGIGKALMKNALTALKGYDTIVIWVLESNLQAIGFYRHIGFSTDGKSKEILGRKAIRMTLDLL